MRSHQVVFVGFVALAWLWPATACAKRAPPKPVPPVVHDGVEYRAPLERMGFVEAVDASSGRKLWETRVYSVFINPFMERDVQDVFITTLKVKNGRLLVSNEAGKTFRVDLRTGHVEGTTLYWIPLFCIAGVLVFAALLTWRRTASNGRRAPLNAGSVGAPPASVS